jgi:hypothetical protein
MIQTLNSDENKEARNEWEKQKKEESNTGGTDETRKEVIKEDRNGTYKYENIEAARKAPQSFGGWEYLVKWEGHTETTWEKAINMTTRQATRQIELDVRKKMETAQTKKRRPASLHERIEREMKKGSKRHKDQADAAHRACTQQKPSDEDARKLMEILQRHAATVHEAHEIASKKEAGTWTAGEADSMTGRIQTWEPPVWQTYYPPQHETIPAGKEDGGTEEEETRACMGLDPATERDKQMPDEVIVTTNQDLKQREYEEKEGAEKGKYDPYMKPMQLIQRGAKPNPDKTEAYWATTAPGYQGYNETGNDYINKDPNLRVWQRTFAMEAEKGTGLRVGSPKRKVKCDKAGQEMISQTRAR